MSNIRQSLATDHDLHRLHRARQELQNHEVDTAPFGALFSTSNMLEQHAIAAVEPARKPGPNERNHRVMAARHAQGTQRIGHEGVRSDKLQEVAKGSH